MRQGADLVAVPVDDWCVQEAFLGPVDSCGFSQIRNYVFFGWWQTTAISSLCPSRHDSQIMGRIVHMNVPGRTIARQDD